jgi:hypothetical protein
MYFESIEDCGHNYGKRQGLFNKKTLERGIGDLEPQDLKRTAQI